MKNYCRCGQGALQLLLYVVGEELPSTMVLLDCNMGNFDTACTELYDFVDGAPSYVPVKNCQFFYMVRQ